MAVPIGKYLMAPVNSMLEHVSRIPPPTLRNNDHTDDLTLQAEHRRHLSCTSTQLAHSLDPDDEAHCKARCGRHDFWDCKSTWDAKPNLWFSFAQYVQPRSAGFSAELEQSQEAAMVRLREESQRIDVLTMKRG